MESSLQVPKISYTRDTSVTSTMSNVEGRKPMVGRNAGVELVPRPSDSPLDPLNWPQWKKELAFGSLVLGSAVIGILKTILVTVNGVIATELNCSYMAATALTGLPLIIGAFAGMGSTVLAQKVGKRGIYLTSSVLLLAGAIWNMHVEQSYAQFMVSRIFQGVAWGAFESLVLTSFNDMFFVHQRSRHVVIYNVSNIFFTWGTPILGGYLSQTNEGFRNQIMAINIIQAFSIVLLIFATPETAFSRSSTSTSQSPNTTTVSAPSAGKFKTYLSTLRFTIPPSSSMSKSEMTRPLRALAAPTTILTFLLTAPPTATALAVASTLSLLFSSMPTFLFPARIGYLFIAPLVLSLLLYTASSFTLTRAPRSKKAHSQPFLITIPALMLAFAGTLAFGLYTYGKLMSTTRAKGSQFTLYVQGQDLSLQIVSVLFGLLVAGAMLVNAAGVSILTSTSALGSEPQQQEEDHQEEEGVSNALQTAHRLLQDVLTGIFIIGMPLWVKSGADMLAGLKDAAIALAVVQVVVGSSVAALLWAQGEGVARLDARGFGA
ncbi:putative MFS-type transporter [Lachnellula subtilissima]|uniref:Putative MFS-type transporter n=1 Tax=Lachnellula subtilissima TaxID=602034 RepID=A0A8H8U6C8_9HELO|nr:putative MFS-type transporter [Lachnellula subtilissima]